MDSKKFSYNILERVAVLSDNGHSTTKELNLVSFNGAKPKYDIRSWTRADGEEKMFKGITLTKEEAAALKVALNSCADL